MSNGNWDYFHVRFSCEMDDFCEDIKEKFPELSEILLRNSKVLVDIINDIDREECGGFEMKSYSDFEKESIGKLKEVNSNQ